MTIKEALLNYFDNFTGIERYGEDKYISPDYLTEDIMFSIMTSPDANGGVIYKDILGNIDKGHTFMFSAYFTYSEDKKIMIENSSFFEELIYWVEGNNKKKVLPIFPEDDGRHAIKIELVTTPYLDIVDPDNQSAMYTCTFRFIYRERRY